MKIFVYLFFLLSTSLVFGNDLTGKKLLCSKLLWGFDFISSDEVKVISTDINNITYVNKYYYKADNKLPYVNLYLSQKNTTNAIFSIHNQTLRVDIWTMTSGGNTTREIIPAGFCREIKINNILNYIKNLKNPS
tara:strand:- start:828 stop:1229 length:402 start_codon:yes stop_codon:yes gene_type:complete